MAVETIEEIVSYEFLLPVTTPAYTSLEEDADYIFALVDDTDTGTVGETAIYVISELGQASQQYIMNKCWDEIAGAWVRWQTLEIDHGGSYYPGPGDFSTQTQFYRIETVTFTRI